MIKKLYYFIFLLTLTLVYAGQQVSALPQAEKADSG